MLALSGGARGGGRDSAGGNDAGRHERKTPRVALSRMLKLYQQKRQKSMNGTGTVHGYGVARELAFRAAWVGQITTFAPKFCATCAGIAVAFCRSRAGWVRGANVVGADLFSKSAKVNLSGWCGAFAQRLRALTTPGVYPALEPPVQKLSFIYKALKGDSQGLSVARPLTRS